MIRNRMKEHRARLGLKQEELAKLVGVRRETIGNLEKGRYNSSAWLSENRWSETDFTDTNRTPFRRHTWAMAPPSISVNRGEKVPRIHSARCPFTANQSPVDTRPVTAGWPREASSSAQHSGCQVGKAT